VEESIVADLVFAPAVTLTDLVGAARVVHDSYGRRGILAPHPSGLRVTKFGVRRESFVFVAKKGERVVGTITVVLDSPLGLPVEEIYKTEIGAQRSAGIRIAEVGPFGVEPGVRQSGIAFALEALCARAARLLPIDDVVIAVHPRVEDLYRRLLTFERIGPARLYPGLGPDALTIAMCTEAVGWARRLRAMYARHGEHGAAHTRILDGTAPNMPSDRAIVDAFASSARAASHAALARYAESLAAERAPKSAPAVAPGPARGRLRTTAPWLTTPPRGPSPSGTYA
jgi:hypothetical protein